MKIKARVTRLLVVEFRLCKKLDISIMKHHLRNLQNVSNKYLPANSADTKGRPSKPIFFPAGS